MRWDGETLSDAARASASGSFGHVPHWEKAGEVNETIIDFLRRRI
jgi:pimeloyl-ACP methyl ester carboxylesterase